MNIRHPLCLINTPDRYIALFDSWIATPHKWDEQRHNCEVFKSCHLPTYIGTYTLLCHCEKCVARRGSPQINDECDKCQIYGIKRVLTPNAKMCVRCDAAYISDIKDNIVSVCDYCGREVDWTNPDWGLCAPGKDDITTCQDETKMHGDDGYCYSCTDFRTFQHVSESECNKCNLTSPVRTWENNRCHSCNNILVSQNIENSKTLIRSMCTACKLGVDWNKSSYYSCSSTEADIGIEN